MIQSAVLVTLRCDFTGCKAALHCEDETRGRCLNQAVESGWSIDSQRVMTCRCPAHVHKYDHARLQVRKARAAAGGAR